MKRTTLTSVWVHIVWVVLLTILAGCQTDAPLPTPIVLPSPTSTLTPSHTPTITHTPTPVMTATPSPTEFFGRTIQAGPGKGLLRVMNLTSDTLPLDFYLNGVPFITGLRQTNLSAQTPILPDTYTASLTSDNTGVSQALTIAADQNLDILAVGEGEGRQLVVISQPTEPVRAGEVWLSFANALPDVENITITLDDVATASLTGYSASEPAITVAGDKLLRATSGERVLLEQSISLRELTLYTFILSTNPISPDGVQLLRLEAPVLGRYSLRVVNLSAEAREVDIYLENNRVGSTVGFGGSTTPQEVVTGSQRLSVYTAGADRAASMPLVNNYAFNGQAGTSLILLLTGPASALEVVTFTDRLEAVPPANSRIIFFNNVDDVTGLVAGINGEDLENFRPLAVGEFSTPRFISQGEYNFTFSDADNSDSGPIENKLIAIPAGQTLLYAVTGRDDVLVPVYGYPVEENPALNPEGTAIPQSRLRFINALSGGISVDIYVDGVLNFPALFAYSSGPLSTIIGEDFSLLVRQANAGPALLDIRLGIPAPGDYSVFLFGSPIDGLQAFLIPDNTLQVNPDVGTFRLVNLSGDPTDIYSLGYYVYPPDVTPVAPTSTPFPIPTNTPDPNFPTTPVPTLEPLTAPQDVRRIIREVQPRTASNQNIAPRGLFDLTLLNTNNRILGALNAIQIPVGQHYDIVAYTYRTASGVKTELFIAPYPPR